ncbi:uncharacterized protein BT62DRAFT_305933 [Guyanagaster necrorhizus]|uniref:Protein kinase domain-containing protein n=1 Tax=Guyanagaster necrorhizus TaxID=856835 RepID=A0A9P7VNF4_9AGAR|nr:uncharacterized protein BT62DRAFT_305933 [Guyanagaster necrorhizus MCA 3950]KAG7443949.1 hypothetical protein BT62DRAFT_305933 [Guyanagaster necrorhizus MCA 3950]
MTVDFEWPKTIPEWRNRCWEPEGSRPYDLWKPEPLQNFFQEHGYTLWISMYEQGLGDNVELLPPNGEPRRPDGFTFLTRYQCEPGIVIYKSNFSHVNNIHCPARTIHNQDVLIRLVSIDGDVTADEHYEAIQRLSAGQSAFRGDNYTLPLLNELEFNGLKFVVFPLLSLGAAYMPWFYNVAEILDYLMQVFKGVKFCHDNLIAHLDLDSDNILYNFAGARMQPNEVVESNVTGPFRSHFPIRYYITDFEMAVCFDKDSDPASRKITGLPNDRVGRAGEYDREYAPEMLLSEPYCPFKVDVWYLGRMLNIDMDTEVKGFIETHLKALHEDFSFDDVFGKYFAQDIIQSEQIMQAFDEVRSTTTVQLSFT